MSRPRRKRNKPLPDSIPFASILDGVGDAIQIIDVEWNCLYINQAAADLGGKVALDMRGTNVWAAFPEMVGSPLEASCRRSMREQVRIDCDFYFSPGAKWFEIHLHPSPKYLTVYAIDITRRVQAETHAQAQDQAQAETRIEHLSEIDSLNARLQLTNEVLILSAVGQHELMETTELLNARLHQAMQESHHRIKNNLQIISALVDLQIGETDGMGPTASDEHLHRINHHIRALANIHDLLTQQAKDHTESDYVSARAILGQLIPMLQETSGGRMIKSKIADILLPVQKAASLSLLVSECISNAIKHCRGEIEVTLCVEGGMAQLEICDDGKGFAPGFDPGKAAHTGLSLIDSTARHDLRGEVRFENNVNGGGRVSISFPIPAVT